MAPIADAPKASAPAALVAELAAEPAAELEIGAPLNTPLDVAEATDEDRLETALAALD